MLHQCYCGVLNGSSAAGVWLADSKSEIVEAVGARKKKLCIIIAKNKRPAIHIPGQILHPEPLMSHAMICIPWKRFTRKDFENLGLHSKLEKL
jgi:hypothetical protein